MPVFSPRDVRWVNLKELTATISSHVVVLFLLKSPKVSVDFECYGSAHAFYPLLCIQ